MKIMIAGLLVVLIMLAIYFIMQKKNATGSSASDYNAGNATVVADATPAYSDVPVPVVTNTKPVTKPTVTNVIQSMLNPASVLMNCKQHCMSMHPFNATKRNTCIAGC